MKEILIQLGVAAVPALISGIITYIVSRRQSKADLEQIKESNKHEIDKLMKQHQVDIENLEKKHQFEMELKDKDYENKIKIMEKEKEIDIAKETSKTQNEIVANAMGNSLSNVLGSIFSSDSVQNYLKEEIDKKINK